MKYIIKNKCWRLTEDYNCDKLLYLLVDRPDKINCYNDFTWIRKDEYHRNYDLPACSSNAYNLFWYKNDHLQRENKKSQKIWNYKE